MNTYSVVNIFDVTLRPQLNVTGVVEVCFMLPIAPFQFFPPSFLGSQSIQGFLANNSVFS